VAPPLDHRVSTKRRTSPSAQIEMINRVPQRTLNVVVVSVSRARIECTSDESGNELKGIADGTGCVVAVRNLADKKVDEMYGGLEGCHYKKGQRKTIRVEFGGCGDQFYDVGCTLGPEFQAKLYNNLDPFTDRDAFCTTTYKSYIVGTFIPLHGEKIWKVSKKKKH
jgi:hypothetical protein